MLPERLLIGVLLTSLVVTGVMVFSNDFLTGQGKSTVDISGLNETASILSTSNSMRTAVQGSRITGESSSSSPFVIIRGVYNSILLIFNMFDVFTNIVGSMAEYLFLPAGIGGIILTIISISIIFAVIYLVFKNYD